MPRRDYYEILGIDENASQQDIKNVYRKLAKKYHPDANKGDTEAEKRFKEISEAYSVLKDPDKRKKYDQMRKYGAFEGGQPGGFDFRNFGGQGFDFGQFSQQGFKGFRSGRSGGIFDEFFTVGGLGDIFSQMFDQSSSYQGTARKSQPKTGTIESDITIPFELAVKGGKQFLNINVEERCPVCNGSGAAKDANPQTCPQCEGRGTISMSQGFFAVNRTCPRCYGRGIFIDKPCSNCNGTGEVKRKKRVSVNIPQGIQEGAKLRLRGIGSNGTGKKSKGDLVLKIHIAPHRFFRKSNNDIYCEVPIDEEKAKKGTKIRVNTVYNKKAEVKIKPGTQDGTVYRLKGLGVKSKHGVGDQYVTIRVQK